MADEVKLRSKALAVMVALLALTGQVADGFAPSAQTGKGAVGVDIRLMRSEGGSASSPEEVPWAPSRDRPGDASDEDDRISAVQEEEADTGDDDGFVPPILPANGSYTCHQLGDDGKTRTAVYEFTFGVDGKLEGMGVDSEDGSADASMPGQCTLTNGTWSRYLHTLSWYENWEADTKRNGTLRKGTVKWGGKMRSVIMNLFQSPDGTSGIVNCTSFDESVVPILKTNASFIIHVEDPSAMIKSPVLQNAVKEIVANVSDVAQKCINVSLAKKDTVDFAALLESDTYMAERSEKSTPPISATQNMKELLLKGGIEVTAALDLVCGKKTSYNNELARAVVTALSMSNAESINKTVVRELSARHVDYTILGVTVQAPVVNPGVDMKVPDPSAPPGADEQNANGTTIAKSSRSATDVAKDIADQSGDGNDNTLVALPNASGNATKSSACRYATSSLGAATLVALAAARVLLMPA